MEPWVPKKPAEILTKHRLVSAGKGLSRLKTNADMLYFLFLHLRIFLGGVWSG